MPLGGHFAFPAIVTDEFLHGKIRSLSFVQIPLSVRWSEKRIFGGISVFAENLTKTAAKIPAQDFALMCKELFRKRLHMIRIGKIINPDRTCPTIGAKKFS